MHLFSQIILFITSIILTLMPMKTYKEGLTGQPKTFLPNEIETQNDKVISKLLYRGLFKYDKGGNLIGDLAENYDVSDDGLSYTVFLRKNQRWSDGREITSDDLLYSAFTSSNLSEIATDKIDKYSIKYTLPNKFSPFISLLTGGVTPSTVGSDHLSAVSSGPYKVIRIKKEGPIIKEIVLLKIDKDYKIPRVVFRFYENEDQLFTASKLGEIDSFTSNKDASWPNLTENVYYQRGIYYSLIFNLRNAKFNSLDFRKKLYFATPVEDIAKNNGLLAKGPISESKFTNEKLNYNLYNPNLTENLNNTIVLTVPDVSEHLETANKIKDAWKKIGIEVTIKALDPVQIENEIINKRDFEILLYGQEVSRDPDRYVLWHSTRMNYPGLNLSGFESVKSDRALEEGRSAQKDEDRMKHYKMFQDVMYENVPAVFLYHPTLRFYTSKKVKVTPEPNLYYDYDRYLDFENWDIT